jgi:hypothetical protein
VVVGGGVVEVLVLVEVEVLVPVVEVLVVVGGGVVEVLVLVEVEVLVVVGGFVVEVTHGKTLTFKEKFLLSKTLSDKLLAITVTLYVL